MEWSRAKAERQVPHSPYSDILSVASTLTHVTKYLPQTTNNINTCGIWGSQSSSRLVCADLLVGSFSNLDMEVIRPSETSDRNIRCKHVCYVNNAPLQILQVTAISAILILPTKQISDKIHSEEARIVISEGKGNTQRPICRMSDVWERNYICDHSMWRRIVKQSLYDELHCHVPKTSKVISM
jgi:hypothetical protein